MTTRQQEIDDIVRAYLHRPDDPVALQPYLARLDERVRQLVLSDVDRLRSELRSDEFDLWDTFNTLFVSWFKLARIHSSPRARMQPEEAAQIKQMGDPAIRFLLIHLKYHASMVIMDLLAEMTPRRHPNVKLHGDVHRARLYWLHWGSEHGYID